MEHTSDAAQLASSPRASRGTPSTHSAYAGVSIRPVARAPGECKRATEPRADQLRGGHQSDTGRPVDVMGAGARSITVELDTARAHTRHEKGHTNLGRQDRAYPASAHAAFPRRGSVAASPPPPPASRKACPFLSQIAGPASVVWRPHPRNGAIS
jgi:hypothetical protein